MCVPRQPEAPTATQNDVVLSPQTSSATVTKSPTTSTAIPTSAKTTAESGRWVCQHIALRSGGTTSTSRIVSNVSAASSASISLTR
jgi:hypothetical protein